MTSELDHTVLDQEDSVMMMTQILSHESQTVILLFHVFFVDMDDVNMQV